MLVLSAAGLVLAMIFTALAVDIGFLAADKRTDQKIADMAALDASRNLNNIQSLAEASALRNGFVIDPKRTVFAELVTPDGSGDYVPSATGKFVRVTIKSPRKPFFPFVSQNERTVTARAVAGGEPEAEISVGSTLASLDLAAVRPRRHPRPDAGALGGQPERRQLQRPGQRQRRPAGPPDQPPGHGLRRRVRRSSCSTPTSGPPTC